MEYPIPIRKTDIRSDRTHFYWEYLCECKNTFIARKSDVTAGRIRTCGCYQKPRSNWRDYAGQTINHLHVTREIGLNQQGLIMWEAYCSYNGCGNRIEISSQLLGRGQESCGCKARSDTRERSLEKYREMQ